MEIKNDDFYGETVILETISTKDDGSRLDVRLVKSKSKGDEPCIDIRHYSESKGRYEKGLYISVKDFLSLMDAFSGNDFICNLQPRDTFSEFLKEVKNNL